ncbi:MAG: type II secretion system protein [Proteobacteria bacterium]|nr:type II secretion system protein [Actinomycetes bacterium]MCP4870457.1 type II secretion system protein [Pseudomonadota bacterium]
MPTTNSTRSRARTDAGILDVSRRGFTIVEVVFVLIILGFVASLGFTTILSVTKATSAAQERANIHAATLYAGASVGAVAALDDVEPAAVLELPPDYAVTTDTTPGDGVIAVVQRGTNAWQVCGYGATASVIRQPAEGPPPAC